MARTKMDELKCHGWPTLVQGTIATISVYMVLALVVAVTPPAVSRLTPSEWFLNIASVELPDFVEGENPTVRSTRVAWPYPAGIVGRWPIPVTGSVEVRDLQNPSWEPCQGMGHYTIDLNPPNHRDIPFNKYVGNPCALPAGLYQLTVGYEFNIWGVSHSVAKSIDFAVSRRHPLPRDSPT